jgi:hypothetical protein
MFAALCVAVFAFGLNAPCAVFVVLDEALAAGGADIAPLELMTAYCRIVVNAAVKGDRTAATGVA